MKNRSLRARCPWLLPLLLGAVLAFGCDDEPSETETDTATLADTSETTGTDATTSDPDGTTAPDGDATTADGDTTDGDTVVADAFEIAGLDGPVSVAYDEHGIPHVQCTTDADCAAAMGYIHAQNRFFFMDFVRSAMRAELGRVVPLGDDIGAALLNADTARRTFFTTRDGRALEEAMVDELDPEMATLAERYAVGVNAWLDDARNSRNGAVLSGEYALNILYPGAASQADRAAMIRDWEVADSMAIALSLYDDLANRTALEIGLGVNAGAMVAYDATLASDVFSLRPTFEVATMPASGEMFGLLDGLVQPIDQRVGALEEQLARFQDKIDLLERAKGFANQVTNRSKRPLCRSCCRRVRPGAPNRAGRARHRRRRLRDRPRRFPCRRRPRNR